MKTYQIAQLIALTLAIAVLVILIVVLTQNKVGAPENQDQGVQITMLNTKVNWLFALEIASVGIMVLFGLISLFGWMRWEMPCA
jgi:hypothetical protein